MKELIKYSSLLGLGKVAGVVLNMVKVKVSAMFLGADGVGVLSQVLQFQSILNRITELGIGSGVTKYAAEYHASGNSEKLRKLIISASSGFLILGCSIGLATALGSKLIAQWILDDAGLFHLIILTGIGVLLQTQINVIIRVFQGLMQMRKMVAYTLLSTFVGVITAIPMVIFLDVLGAVLALVITNVVIFLVGYYRLKKVLRTETGIALTLAVPDREIVNKLLKFGGANSTVFLSNVVTLLIIRSIIIDEYGSESNGLYQVATGVATQYIGIVAVAIWQYGMPKVATIIGKNEEIKQLQNDATRLGLLILTPTVIGLLATRQFWIPILYSPEFMGAYALITWQLFGELIRSIKWGPNMVNQPYERYRFIILQSVANAVIFLSAFLLLKSDFGFFAAPLAYFITQVTLVLITLVGHYYYDKFILRSDNWLLILSSIATISIAVYGTYDPAAVSWVVIMILFFVALTWLFLSINKAEKQIILQMINRIK